MSSSLRPVSALSQKARQASAEFRLKLRLLAPAPGNRQDPRNSCRSYVDVTLLDDVFGGGGGVDVDADAAEAGDTAAGRGGGDARTAKTTTKTKTTQEHDMRAVPVSVTGWGGDIGGGGAAAWQRVLDEAAAKKDEDEDDDDDEKGNRAPNRGLDIVVTASMLWTGGGPATSATGAKKRRKAMDTDLEDVPRRGDCLRIYNVVVVNGNIIANTRIWETR